MLINRYRKLKEADENAKSKARRKEGHEAKGESKNKRKKETK